MFYKNNKISIILTKSVENEYQIKHIDIKYSYIRKLFNKKEVTIK